MSSWPSRGLPIHWWADAGEWRHAPAERWLDLDTHLVSIGSCFAVNFSRWIALHGVEVLAPGWGFHYNVFAIRDEIARALGRPAPPRIRWCHQPQGEPVRFLDPLRHTISGVSPEDLDALTASIDTRARNALDEASAIIVTLGLSEVWEQRIAGRWLPLNISPPADVFDVSIHRVRMPSVEETIVCILDVVQMLRAARDAFTIVFTVSPIPLKTTFLMPDVRVANLRSKALLLTAVHEAKERPGGQFLYFPSFEMFWSRGAASDLWQADRRHPTAAGIEMACKEFVRVFAREPSMFHRAVDFRVKAAE